MAEQTFDCTLITSDAHLLGEKVASAEIPLWDGQAGILPGRAPLMAKLGLGELRLRFPGGGERSYLLEGGFTQMVGNHLRLLTETATPVESISTQEAHAELAEAQARRPQSADEMERVTTDRRRAQLKVRLAERFRHNGGGI